MYVLAKILWVAGTILAVAYVITGHGTLLGAWITVFVLAVVCAVVGYINRETRR